MTSERPTIAAAESQHSDYLDPHHLYAAYAAAQGRYWRRRAKTLLEARPRHGDFHGRATPAELSARWHRLTAEAEACVHRAEVAERYGATRADRALILDVATHLVAA